jgi:Mn2+/Fe2+ NRAMP family transporter
MKSDMDLPSEASLVGIKAPPRRLLGMLLSIGPGIVVAGSVMGSGELINTPKQAAEFGFVLLWAVILSCVIKFFLQIEIGRHALVHNRTPIQALNTLPFPKFRGTSWIALLFVLTTTPTALSLAGMLAASAGMMDSLLPLSALLPLSDSTEMPTRIWTVILTAVLLGVLWRGIYRDMEKLIAVLVLGFSLAVVMALFLIQGTEFRITGEQLLSGLSFSLGENRELAAYAVISLMGALGTSANELFMYPYWILEKGYTRFTGAPDSNGWVERTRGWIRILQLDVGICTLLATVITAAFFLIGAAVLHGQGLHPEGLGLVDSLARMFTDTYGPWSRNMFLIGAFCTLFSTMVVAAAAFGRMWGDTLVSLKLIASDDKRKLGLCHRIVVSIYFILMLPVALFTTDPAGLVIFAAFFAGLVCTPLLMFAICWLAFRTDRRFRMGPVSTACLVVSVLAIVACIVVSTIA